MNRRYSRLRYQGRYFRFYNILYLYFIMFRFGYLLVNLYIYIIDMNEYIYY
jgi:hypothetical protein